MLQRYDMFDCRDFNEASQLSQATAVSPLKNNKNSDVSMTHIYRRLVLAQGEEEAGVDEHLAVGEEEGLALATTRHQARKLQPNCI